MPHTNEDRRLQILEKHFPTPDHEDAAAILNAMDDYFTERALELLEYMANNHVKCGYTGDGSYFNFKGESISKEQIFENFL